MHAAARALGVFVVALDRAALWSLTATSAPFLFPPTCASPTPACCAPRRNEPTTTAPPCAGAGANTTIQRFLSAHGAVACPSRRRAPRIQRRVPCQRASALYRGAPLLPILAFCLLRQSLPLVPSLPSWEILRRRCASLLLVLLPAHRRLFSLLLFLPSPRVARGSSLSRLRALAISPSATRHIFCFRSSSLPRFSCLVVVHIPSVHLANGDCARSSGTVTPRWRRRRSSRALPILSPRHPRTRKPRLSP